MPACVQCICIFLRRIQMTSDTEPRPPLCSLPRQARWVLFGGTEPVKEGNVTRGPGERQGGSHYSGVFTMVHCRSYRHTYRSSRHRPGAGGRGQVRVSWSRSWSPCPGRRPSPGAGTWCGAWRGGGRLPGRSPRAEA